MTESRQKNYEGIISELRDSLGWMDLVLSNVSEGILVIGDDLKALFINDEVGKMVNKPRITLLGKPIWEILALSVDGELLHENDFREALQRDSFKSFADRYQFKSGEKEFTVEISTSYIAKMNQAIFFIRDVTRQLENEQALLEERIARTREKVGQQKMEESRRLLQGIINGTSALVFLKDLDGKYVLANKQFKKAFGVGGTKIKGKTDRKLFSTEIAKVLFKNDKEVLETGESMKWEESIALDDETCTYLFLKYPLLNSIGKPESICGVLTDITERKKLEESKDDFIKMASHELQTPITSVKMLLDFTRKNIEEGEVEESLRDLSKFRDQLDKLEKLVDELLDVSRMETGKFELNRRKFSLNALAREAIEIAQGTTIEHNIHLSDSSKEFHIYADRQRIYQLLVNFLSNAIKYSPEGGDIIVRIQAEVNYVTVSVQDFGIGISEEYQEQIFERFNRGSTQAQKYKGLGLGLYIASEVVKLHGGTMHVESEEGEGSTFSFTLPISS